MNPRPNPAPRAPIPMLAAVAALVATAALVAGCSLSRPAPIKQAYLIEAATPPAAVKPHSATLRVGIINVTAPSRGRAFVYRETDLRYESDFYSEFLVLPAAMIGEATARSLDRASVFARIVPPGAPPDGDYVLDGFVGAIYGDVREPGKPAAELSITYFLARADNPTPFWSKEYRQHVAIATMTPDAYAAALSTAFAAIMGDLARDLAAVELAAPQAASEQRR